LIVENEVNVAKMLASILYDYQTIIAVTLAEAMQVVTEHIDELDGALIDLHLTERLDSAGLEVLAYIRDRRPELPRMLITASPPAGSQEQMRRVYGIIDTLVKGADGYSASGVRDAVGQMFNELPESARRRTLARLESHAIKIRRELMQRTIAARRGIRAGERDSYQELERSTDALEKLEQDTDSMREQLLNAAPADLNDLVKSYVDRWPISVHDAGAA
jgi:response regulator RpfG family c-di-GMP phosphodiesterase